MDIWLKTGAAPRSTTVRASDLRSAVVTDDTMYWADLDGVHRSALDGSAVSLIWATADVFAIAASGGHLVAADGEGNLFAIVGGGTRRQVATGLQSDTDLLAVSGARAYVVTSQVRGPGGEGDPSVVWAVDLVGSTPPQELLRADSITGFCAGPGGEVVWLELGRPASPGGARRARLMSDGRRMPLAELSVTEASQLAADDRGHLFFRASLASSSRTASPPVLFEVSRDGTTQVRAELPADADLVGVFGERALVDTPSGLVTVPLR